MLHFRIGDIVQFEYTARDFTKKAHRTIYLYEFVKKLGSIVKFKAVLLHDSQSYYSDNVEVFTLSTIDESVKIIQRMEQSGV